MTELSVHQAGSHRVTFDQLKALPTPEPMGPRHRPIPHAVLVDTILDAAAERNWTVKKTDLAVARNGKVLFGVLDLVPPQVINLREGIVQGIPNPEVGKAFGFRSSVNQAFNIRGVAGGRVFVCDNLALSGAEFVMKHKLTTRLNLPLLVNNAFNKFIEQSDILMEELHMLKEERLLDSSAKQRIFDVFNQGAMPLHLFDDVSRNYFRPADEHTDCQPRSAWGLHNACTRAVKLLKPAAQFTSSRDVGRIFGLGQIIPTEEASPVALSHALTQLKKERTDTKEVKS